MTDEHLMKCDQAAELLNKKLFQTNDGLEKLRHRANFFHAILNTEQDIGNLTLLNIKAISRTLRDVKSFCM